MNGNDEKLRTAIRMLDTDIRRHEQRDDEMSQYRVRVYREERDYLIERLRRRERG